MSGSKYDDKNYTPELPSFQSHEVRYISFNVFGIREPGQEIKLDVIKSITKKLDYNTLDLINQYIARNPKCKLTPKDVEVNDNVYYTPFPKQIVSIMNQEWEKPISQHMYYVKMIDMSSLSGVSFT